MAINFKSKGINKTIIIALLLGVVSLTVALFYALTRPICDEDIYLYIDEDDTHDSLYVKLNELNNQENTSLKCLTTCFSFNLPTGCYRLSKQETVIDTYLKLKRGRQTPVKLVVPTGWTVNKIVSQISHQMMIDSARLMDYLNDSSVLSFLECTKETLPARFIPNTYEVWWNLSDVRLVRRIYREYKDFWNSDRRQKAEALGLTLDEVSTLASIVSRETNDKEDMSIIAGLYYNRLNKGMLLQSCPTVIFARKDFSLTRLKDPTTPDSPYNTYLYLGLPPGPICIPPIKAIDAVLNMKQHNYIYMCAKEDFSGKHNFSASYKEHQRHARNYQRAYNKRFK